MDVNQGAPEINSRLFFDECSNFSITGERSVTKGTEPMVSLTHRQSLGD
jgi:hypothetical protein